VAELKLHQVEANTDSESVLLSFPVTPSSLQQIQRDAIFHYDEAMFASSPPSRFDQGTLRIIGPKLKALNIDENGETHLNDVDWQIFDLTVDNVVHPTFISLRRDGRLPGTLVQSMRDFAVNKASGPEVSARERAALEHALDKIVSIAQSQRDENSVLDQLPRVIDAYAQDVMNEPISRLIRDCISAVFSSLQLHIVERNDSFSFGITVAGVRWESVLSVSPDLNAAVLTSDTLVHIDTASLSTLLQELEQINNTLTQSRFDYDATEERLQHRSEINVTCLADDSLLRAMLNAHLEGMQTILPVLRERYGERISFLSVA
jgi:hypothetical protein